VIFGGTRLVETRRPEQAQKARTQGEHPWIRAHKDILMKACCGDGLQCAGELRNMGVVPAGGKKFYKNFPADPPGGNNPV